ncbi:uncharacterized protein LOC123930193 [Meles meles]|uniref:uncharacterized protein LOC123930193 n=1 Tax=Meles meles TaxID=9662 RepID=UPI001E69C58C|nr:uncharacterized protein LOC123930193 [Meles meles]
MQRPRERSAGRRDRSEERQLLTAAGPRSQRGQEPKPLAKLVSPDESRISLEGEEDVIPSCPACKMTSTWGKTKQEINADRIPGLFLIVILICSAGPARTQGAFPEVLGSPEGANNCHHRISPPGGHLVRTPAGTLIGHPAIIKICELHAGLSPPAAPPSVLVGIDYRECPEPFRLLSRLDTLRSKWLAADFCVGHVPGYFRSWESSYTSFSSPLTCHLLREACCCFRPEAVLSSEIRASGAGPLRLPAP